MNNDLISRSALLEKAIGVVTYDEGGWDCNVRAVTVDVVENAPAVDAVEVVRCKDCVYWGAAKANSKGFLICPASRMEIMARTYCSYGDRGADHD